MTPAVHAHHRDALTERGRSIARSGLAISEVVLDLDETVWDWSAPILEQRRLLFDHVEHLFLRRPLLWLLRGMQQETRGEHARIWTAGYGYRIDRVVERDPDFAAVAGLRPGDVSEDKPHVVTRLDFVRGFERRPDLIPYPQGRWIGEKIPGLPTAAGKPAIDQGRVLLDDRETNCRRFVAAGPGRSAIWLRGTPRIMKDNLPLRGPGLPARRDWSDGIASAFEAIARGRAGLYPVDPLNGGPERVPLALRLPHRVVVRDWLSPGRAVARALSRQSGASVAAPAAAPAGF